MMRFIKNRTVQRIWSGICAVGIISCFLLLTVYGAEPTGENQTQTENVWEENYTDTSSEKGLLAVRCQAFQGFPFNPTSLADNTSFNVPSFSAFVPLRRIIGQKLLLLRKALEIAQTTSQKKIVLEQSQKTGTFLGLIAVSYTHLLCTK